MFNAWLTPGLRGSARHTRQLFLNAMQVVLQPLGGNTNLLQHRRNHALAVIDQRQQQMHRQHLRVAQLGRLRLRLLHRLLRLDRQFFPTNCHGFSRGQWSEVSVQG